MCVEGSQPIVHLRGALKRGVLAKKGHLKRLRPPATVGTPRVIAHHANATAFLPTNEECQFCCELHPSQRKKGKFAHGGGDAYVDANGAER